MKRANPQKEKYPIEEGWIKVTAKLKPSGGPIDETGMKRFFSGGKPNDCEWGEFRQLKTRTILWFRKK